MTKPTAEQTAFNEIWQAICDIAAKEKKTPINTLPGLFHTQAGEWKLWVNGQHIPVDTAGGFEVPPFHCYVTYNDFPMGLMAPNDATLLQGSVFGLRDALKAMAAR